MSEQAPAPKKSTRRRASNLALRIGVTALALAWTFSRIDFDDFKSAIAKVTLTALVIAFALTIGNLGVAAFRWGILMRAYGATHTPRWLELWRIYFVSAFYNTFLPGSVVGDALRGHVTRQSFESPAAAYVIVLIERLFGLAGLLVLAGLAAMLHPIAAMPWLQWLGAAGLFGAFGASILPFVGRSLAKVLPRSRLRDLFAVLPTIRSPARIVLVLILSVCTQFIGAMSLHVILSSVHPVDTVISLALAPIASAAAYIPVTVSGLGVREGVAVVLYKKAGVPVAVVGASMLAVVALQFLAAALAGISHVLWPLPRAFSADTQPLASAASSSSLEDHRG